MSKSCYTRLMIILFRFLFWLLVPLQVSLLSDSKIKSGLWSVFLTALLVCGTYVVGSAILKKDFREVYIVAPISNFYGIKFGDDIQWYI